MKRLILPIACGICTVTSDAQTDKQPHPNVIFIYADDLGYTDLSCTEAVSMKLLISTSWQEKEFGLLNPMPHVRFRRRPGLLC